MASLNKYKDNFSLVLKIFKNGLLSPMDKKNRKLLEDEKKARVAGELLIQLGRKSTDFLISVAPPGTRITLITEEKYFFDFYKRQLAYIILPDGSC